MARFLQDADTDVQLEAGCALAQSPSTDALDAVRRYWDTACPTREIREAILLNLGASPLPGAAEFLREVVEANPTLSAITRKALETRSRSSR